jgi:hypothetical protein
MIRKVIIAVLICLVIGGGIWYYFGRTHPIRIEKILSNPRAYEGKVVSIEGEVTDRTGFFIVLRFFKLKDKTGEVTVVTKKSLPELKSKVSVSGRIDEAFPIGDQKLLIFVEESIEKKDSKK